MGKLKYTVLQFKIHDEQPIINEKRTVGASNPPSMFANRLNKNLKKLKKWAKKNNITCYRLYDRDLPEYAVAIDYYDGHVHIQEYQAPSTISPQKAATRLDHILRQASEILQLSPNNIHLKQRKRQRGLSQYEKQNTTGHFFKIKEDKAQFWVNLQDYLDTGLFLDHRMTRKLIAEHAKNKSFLNLFSYTATATVSAALAGATSSISVDLSNTYLDWSKRNFKLNGLNFKQHQLIHDDCIAWLKSAKETFDLIFLDPPTFSNSKKMEQTLDIQRNHIELVHLALARLKPNGLFIFSNNYRRFKFDTSAFENFNLENITKQTIPMDFARNEKVHQCWLIRHKKEPE